MSEEKKFDVEAFIEYHVGDCSCEHGHECQSCTMKRELKDEVKSLSKRLSQAEAELAEAKDIKSYLQRDATVGHNLCHILSRYVGESGQSEGAVEVLERKLSENEELRKRLSQAEAINTANGCEMIDLNKRLSHLMDVAKKQNEAIINLVYGYKCWEYNTDKKSEQKMLELYVKDGESSIAEWDGIKEKNGPHV